MARVRARWLSGRAVVLHVSAVVLTCGCAAAAWWQVNRAEDGNLLSDFYSVMWPVFGILVVTFWWLLIHTDYDQAGLKGLRRQASASPAPPASVAEVPARSASAASTTALAPAADDDPEMAAYNARLARLASSGPKTWRHRDPVVVRRPQ